MTYDEMAVGLLLRNDVRGLRKLVAEASARIEGRIACPDCGHEGPHDDSPMTRDLCCGECGVCFDPDDV